MPDRNLHSCRRAARGVVGALALGLILVGTPGLGCDSAASTTFRETATSAIGSGVKTIMNGVLDGIIAAVEDAGDSSANDDTTTTQ